MKVIKIIMKIISAPLCIFAVIVLCKSGSMGEKISKTFGETVGVFTGSFDGVTKGLSEGEEAGRAEGISAKDTKASIKDKMDEVGKLEVLTAGVGIKNAHKYGEKYASMYLMKGNIIFSVDLTKADFIEELSNNKLLIRLPNPEVDLTLNEEETAKLAERQNKVFDGDAEDGYDAYLNTLKKTQSELESVIGNYDQLVEQAKNSAQTQIRFIAEQASLSEREIIFEFKEEGEDND